MTTAGAFRINTGGNTAAFVVNGLGNVGIGTASPKAKAEFASGLPTSIPTHTDRTNGIVVTDGGAIYGRIGVANFSGAGAGYPTYIQAGDFDGALYYNLLLNPLGGNVGIGTTSPSVALEVSGATNLSSRIRAAKTASGTIEMGADRDTFGSPYISAITNSNLDFFTNDTHRMRITSGGRVGIGTTSPTSILNISGVNADAAIDWTNTTSSTGRSYRWVSLNSGGFAIEDLTASGAERMRITSGGNVLIGATVDSGFKLLVNGTSYTAGLAVNATAYQGNVTMNTGTTYVYNAGSGSHTFTLQSASGSNQVFIVKNASSRSLTIATTGGDVIIDNAGASTSTFTLAANKAMIIQQDGGSTNYIISIY
jgi:hypothetical protein